MSHHTLRRFWALYRNLPPEIQRIADRNFALLKEDPNHPSLHFKKAGKYWSVRIGLDYRALAINADDGLVWFWIGIHSDYEEILSKAK